MSLWLLGAGVAFQSKDPEEEACVWHFPASMVDGEAWWKREGSRGRKIIIGEGFAL